MVLSLGRDFKESSLHEGGSKRTGRMKRLALFGYDKDFSESKNNRFSCQMLHKFKEGQGCRLLIFQRDSDAVKLIISQRTTESKLVHGAGGGEWWYGGGMGDGVEV